MTRWVCWLLAVLVFAAQPAVPVLAGSEDEESIEDQLADVIVTEFLQRPRFVAGAFISSNGWAPYHLVGVERVWWLGDSGGRKVAHGLGLAFEHLEQDWGSFFKLGVSSGLLKYHLLLDRRWHFSAGVGSAEGTFERHHIADTAYGPPLVLGTTARGAAWSLGLSYQAGRCGELGVRWMPYGTREPFGRRGQLGGLCLTATYGASL